MPTRRHFLKTAAAAAALPSALPAAATGPPTGPPTPLPTRILGKTNARLPILGFGGGALPRAWGSPLSTDDRIELVRHAFDRGIRYFDTAGNYMEAQPILGQALQDIRKDAFLVGKVETTDPARVRGKVEKHAVKDFDENRRRQLPAAAIRHVLDDQRFHLLCIGMRLPSDIEANLATLTADTACTPADRQLLSDFAKPVMQSDPIKNMRIE